MASLAQEALAPSVLALDEAPSTPRISQMRGNQLPIDRLMTEGVRRPDDGTGTGGESGDMAEGGREGEGRGGV